MPTSVPTRPAPPFPAGAQTQVFATASARLRRKVPFDAAGWFGVDPSTMLPTHPVLIENVEPGRCADYWHRENTVENVLLFRDLARADRPTAALLAATAGNPRRSTRYREYLAPLGYVDEIRTALRVGERTWGFATLLRGPDRPPFTARDVAAVAAAAPAVAASLAAITAVTRPDLVPGGPDCPGIAVFAGSTSLVSLDHQARRWFTELAGEGWAEADQFRTVTSALTARAAAVAEGHDGVPASARVRAPNGRWLTLYASRQDPAGTGGTSTAVVIGPASSHHVAPILADAYGLTPREQEVTTAVARGLSNADIAGQLFLSPHTVRDHLKAVFGKLEVASRGELVAKLFADVARPVLDGHLAHTGT